MPFLFNTHFLSIVQHLFNTNNRLPSTHDPPLRSHVSYSISFLPTTHSLSFQMMFQAVVAAASLATALGHGHLSSPPSRTELAYRAGQDSCPHCTLENVPSPPNTDGRNYPGQRPFAEPGQSPITMGPCGVNGGNNYNAPSGSWGNIVESYQAGEVLTFESCWNADHKGTYSMRVCPNAALVSRFITSGVTPSSSEMTQLEQCFQDNVLPCTGVSGNRGCDALEGDLQQSCLILKLYDLKVVLS
jgi:hypothetical protein